MATTKEPLVEVRDGIEYELEAVHYKSKCVGLAPTRCFDDDESMLEHYGLSDLCSLAKRQLKQDGKNAVRAKYNKDKVSASAVLKAIGAGELSPEDIELATVDMKAGKGTFTDLCAARLGVGEDALKNADPSHVHWDCAK